MRKREKNPHAVALGRLGGRKKSQAKTDAARRNIRKRWATRLLAQEPEVLTARRANLD